MYFQTQSGNRVGELCNNVDQLSDRYLIKEDAFLKEFIKKYLETKFIRKSKLLILYGVIFATKKGGGLRLYINY